MKKTHHCYLLGSTLFTGISELRTVSDAGTLNDAAVSGSTGSSGSAGGAGSDSGSGAGWLAGALRAELGRGDVELLLAAADGFVGGDQLFAGPLL